MPRPKSISTATRSARPVKKRTLAPRQRVVRGRGDYWTDVKSRWGQGGGKYKRAFSNAGSALGAGIGGAPGAAVGSLVGGLVNRAIYALTGFGDYKIKSNALVHETNGPPVVQNRGKEFVIRHREYIQDMYSASGAANQVSTFALQEYPIQPGSFVTFPWLANIADKFEQYRIEGMLFEFKSMYSDAVVTANGSLGSIILATEYNAGAPPFANKQAMENYEFAQSCKPSCSVLHPIECARSQSVLSELYVRTGTVPPNEDVKTYDFANFYFASQGIPLGGSGNAVNLGELWVTYQISFLKPRIATHSATYIDSGFAYFSGVPSNPAPGQGNPGFAPYGTVPVPISSIVKRVDSNLPIELVADNTFEITLGSVPMAYMFSLSWYSPTNGTWRAPAATLTNATFVNSGTTGSYQTVKIPNNAAGTPGVNGAQSTYFIKTPASTPSNPTARVVISAATFTADQVGGVRFECFINAVPQAIVA